jgi:hypothetical protein
VLPGHQNYWLSPDFSVLRSNKPKVTNGGKLLPARLKSGEKLLGKILPDHFIAVTFLFAAGIHGFFAGDIR